MYVKYDFRLTGVDKVQKSQNTTGKGLFPFVNCFGLKVHDYSLPVHILPHYTFDWSTE